MQTTVEIGQTLFEETARLTGVTEYGVSWEKLIRGEAQLPLQGARFDIAFEGSLEGDRIKGTIKGIDYATVRADGRFDMSIHATITTDDGARIAFYEDGVLTPNGDGTATLRLNMRFTTAHPAYAWLNTVQAWGTGVANQQSGEVRVTASLV